MRRLLSLLSVASAAAGSVELSAPNVANGVSSNFIESLKAKWTQKLSIAGTPATLSGIYDPKASKEFFKELTLDGTIQTIKYKLKYVTGEATTGVTLQSNALNATITAECKVGGKLEQAELSKLAASRVAKIGGVSLQLSPSYALKSRVKKILMSAPLGEGFSVTAEVDHGKTGVISASYELGYKVELGKGRSLSASIESDKTGELTYIDSATLGDVTATASVSTGTGAKPTLALKRSFAF